MFNNFIGVVVLLVVATITEPNVLFNHLIGKIVELTCRNQAPKTRAHHFPNPDLYEGG